MNRRRLAGAAYAAVATLVLAGCGGEAVGAGSSADAVDACPEPVEGFAVTVGADGEALDVPDGIARDARPDPRTLTGPSTADVSDDVIHEVTDSPSPDLPVAVRSCDGVTVEVTDTSRILAVDLYGTLAEIVFSLGLGDRVVGRDTSTGFEQAAQLPLVTPGAHDLNAEAILALDPTVVLTDTSIGPPEVQQQLRDAGIPVIFFDPDRSIDRVPGQIRAVAGALGVPDAGELLLQRTQDEIVTAMSLAPDGGEPLRVAFLYTRGGAVQLLAGPGSGADAMIRALGAVDVGTDLGLDRSFTQITSEALVEAQPDVILMMTAGLESIGGVDNIDKIPGVAQTPAGQNRRVVDMADTDILSFGPRTGQVLTALAEAIYAP